MKERNTQKIRSELCLTPVSEVLPLNINDGITKYGESEVKKYLYASIAKCSIALDIKMSRQRIEIFVEDIIDRYGCFQMEKIILLFKKGRQGYFGETYGKLDMTTLYNWWRSEFGSHSNNPTVSTMSLKPRIYDR